MSYIVVDIEADGPIPSKYSMVCFGAVIVRDGLEDAFYGQVRPISDQWVPEALAVSGFDRGQHNTFEEPEDVMRRFQLWIDKYSVGKPIFISDNPAFDWQFINYYFHIFLGKNPFGFSGRRIGDLYCGLVKDANSNNVWKKTLRRTVHDHNPVNDAKGNAEALLAMRDKFILRIKFE